MYLKGLPEGLMPCPVKQSPTSMLATLTVFPLPCPLPRHPFKQQHLSLRGWLALRKLVLSPKAF